MMASQATRPTRYVPEILIMPEFGTGRMLSKDQFLGEGATATCYSFKDSTNIFAIKASSKRLYGKELREEAKTLRSLRHPNIVGFRCIFEDTDNFYMAIEYCGLGDLFSIRQRLSHVFASPDARHVTRSIADACAYMHKNRIVHCDLNTDNIVVDHELTVKLTDFGNARQFVNDRSEVTMMINFVDTVVSENARNVRLDVSALVRVTHWMLTAARGVRPGALTQLQFPFGMDDQAKDLIRCISTSHVHSEMMEDVLKHPFCSQVPLHELGMACLMPCEGKIAKGVDQLTVVKGGDKNLDFKSGCAFIGGQWVSAEDGTTFEVFNPSSGFRIGRVQDLGTNGAIKAVTVAHDAFQKWRSVKAKERVEVLQSWARIIVLMRNDLATIITREMGKPFSESLREINNGVSLIQGFCDKIKSDDKAKSCALKGCITLKEPVGVVGLITPWTFPSAVVMRKAAAALAVGCTVIVKPSEETPYSALALCELADRAGLPPGVLNVVPSSFRKTPDVTTVLCTHPQVSKISFRGSATSSGFVRTQAASARKKVSLEVEQNAMFILFDGADVNTAVAAAMIAKFQNCGQAFVSTSRILVQEGIYEQFIDQLVNAVGKLVTGDGFTDGVTQGPLISVKSVEELEKLVEDAVSKGATIATGGKRLEKPNFFLPTILTNINEGMMCASDRISGPLAPITKFEIEEDAFEIAKYSPDCSTGYIFCNQKAAPQIISQLTFKIMGVNKGADRAIRENCSWTAEPGKVMEDFEFTRTVYVD